MRVYEYAKNNNLTSKDILNLLKKAGFEFSTHMAVLTDEAIKSLDAALKKTEKQPVETIKNEAVIAKENVPTKSPDKSKVTKILDSKNIELDKSKQILSTIQNKKEYKKPIFQKPLESAKPEPYKNEEKLAVTEIVIHREMPLFEVAEKMHKSSGDLIAVFLRSGKVYNRNQILNVEAIEEVASKLGIKVIRAEKKVSDAISKTSVDGVEKWPIVVVMGHVDHGKTTLLDYIRKTNVASHEKGGITQHIGAYEVDTSHGKITFLDTPGHAAFSQMRRRGAKVTDIAILVVAADDGMMPQTIEAIESAREAQVPIIVAINKIDKISSTASIETIKRQLAQHDLLPEDWGGTTICVPISAKTGQGVDSLLEMIVLQSQLMDLRSKIDVPAKCYVIESKMEKGYGAVATVLPLEGRLSVGDYFICSSSATGKVRNLINSVGQKVQSVDPSIPVVVIGFDKIAAAGDLLEVVTYEKYLEKRSEKEDVTVQAQNLLNQDVGQKVINIILKSDTFGSNEALIGAIKQLSKKSKSTHSLKIIYSGVGDISEKDIDLAINTNSIVFGLHTKIEKNAAVLARELNVEIQTYGIIYKLLEALEEILSKHKEKIITWKKTGEATVKKVFDIKGHGIVAGSYVSDGLFTRNSKVICFRRGKQVGEGRIVSLERNKKTVKEVHSGLEFGFISSGFSEWQVDDVVHCLAENVEKDSKE